MTCKTHKDLEDTIAKQNDKIYQLEKDKDLLNDEIQAINLVKQATKTCKVKKGLVMKTLRAAFFGTLNGPDLINSWVLLSRFSKDRGRISRFL